MGRQGETRTVTRGAMARLGQIDPLYARRKLDDKGLSIPSRGVHELCVVGQRHF